MKKKTLYAAMFAIGLCLLANASRECGKIKLGNCAVTCEPAAKKTEPKKDNIEKEFSFLNLFFFQTT